MLAFPRVNIQGIPTPILYILQTLGGGVTVLGYGVATLTDNQVQTVAFGSVLGAVPTQVFLQFVTPNHTTASPIVGDVEDGTITNSQFGIVLIANPGDAAHKVFWLAVI